MAPAVHAGEGTRKVAKIQRSTVRSGRLCVHHQMIHPVRNHRTRNRIRRPSVIPDETLRHNSSMPRLFGKMRTPSIVCPTERSFREPAPARIGWVRRFALIIPIVILDVGGQPRLPGCLHHRIGLLLCQQQTLPPRVAAFASSVVEVLIQRRRV